MAAIERALTNVQEALRVNASTLSGAVDIVVVRQPDGTLRSTPFHVRFGKLQLLRPDARHSVAIALNGGAPAPFAMRLGAAGEAYFAAPGTASPSPPGTPLAAPLAPPAVAPSARDMVPLTNALKELLQQSRDTPDVASPPGATATPPAAPQVPHAPRSELASPVLRASAAAAAGGGGGGGAGEGHEWQWTWGELPHETPEGAPHPAALSAPGSPLASPRQRRSPAPVLAASSSSSSSNNNNNSAWQPLFDCSQLAGSPAQPLSSSSSSPSPGDGEGEGEVEEGAGNARTHEEAVQEAIDIEALDGGGGRGGPELPRHEPLPELLTPAGAAQDAGAESLLAAGDVQISLCGQFIGSKTVPEAMGRIFEAHAVSRDAFLSDPGMVASPHLVARIGGTYYTGTALLAMLVSRAVYGAPLPAFPLDPSALVQTLPSARRGRWNWRLWPFSRAPQPQPQPQSQQQMQQRGGEGMCMSPRRARRTLRPTQEQLQALGARYGHNTVTFSVELAPGKRRSVSCSLYLLDSDDKIVVSDIDGTITKSDALGHLFSALGRDWSQSGVAQLFTAIHANGYHLLYLTSRSIGLAQTTRNYISSVAQNSRASPAPAPAPAVAEEDSTYRLPPGPVIMSPMRLLTALDKEVVQRCPQEFKIACLTDIYGLFPVGKKPFYAGFGNRDSVCFCTCHHTHTTYHVCVHDTVPHGGDDRTWSRTSL